MASQYSLLRNYGEYVSPYNIDLISQSMGYMQQRVDANREAINQYADSLLNVDIMKPQDREYLNNRLQGLVNEVNDLYRGSNLASGGIAREITSRIGQAMDTRVLNAVAGTREVRRLTKTIEDIKLNDPDKYSPVNEGMAYLPVSAWLEDGKVGSRLAPLHYTPYYDYGKEVDDFMKRAVDLRKATTIQSFPSGKRDGDIVTTTIDRYTPEEIIGDVRPSLSQRALAQINLEGQYMALTNPGLFDQASTAAFVKRYTDTYDMKERALMAEMAGADGNPDKKAALDASLSALRARRKEFEDGASAFIGQSYDPARAGAFIVMNEFLNGVANRWSYDNSFSKMEVDDAYFKRRAADREDAKLRLRERELEIKEWEARNGSKGGSSRSGKTSTDSTEDMLAEGVSVTLPTNLDEKVNKVESYFNTYNKNLNDRTGALARMKAAIGKDAVDGVLADMKDPDKANLYVGCENEEDRWQRWLLNNGGAKNSNIKGDEAKKAYEEFMRTYDIEAFYGNYSNVAHNRWYNMLHAKNDIGHDALDSEVLKAVSSGMGGGLDIWTDNGIVNAEDVLKMDEVWIAGKKLTSTEALRVSALAGLLGANIGLGGSSNPYEDKLLLDEINGTLGTNMTIDSLYGDSVPSFEELDDNGLKLYRFMNFGALQSGRAFGHKWSNYGVKDLVDDAYAAYADVFDKTESQWGNKGMTFVTGTDGFNKLKAMYSANNGNTDGLSSLTITQDDNGQAYIIGSYAPSNTSGVIQEGHQRYMEVNADDLARNGFPIYRSEDKIRVDMYKTPYHIPVSFGDVANVDYQRYVRNKFPDLPYATRTDAMQFAMKTGTINAFANKEAYSSTLSDGKTSVPAPNGDGRMIEIKALYESVLDHMGIFTVDVDGTQGGGKSVDVTVYYRDSKGNDTKAFSYEEDNLTYVDDIVELANTMPQALVVRGLDRIINMELMNYNTPGFEFDRTAEMQNVCGIAVIGQDMDNRIRAEINARNGGGNGGND